MKYLLDEMNRHIESLLKQWPTSSRDRALTDALAARAVLLTTLVDRASETVTADRGEPK